jgi:hypothetical protein
MSTIPEDGPNPELQTRYLLVTLKDCSGEEQDSAASAIEDLLGKWWVEAEYLADRHAKAILHLQEMEERLLRDPEEN